MEESEVELHRSMESAIATKQALLEVSADYLRNE